MIVLVQRVKSASVMISSKKVGQINKGLLLYVGFENGDTEEDLKYCIKKVVNLRIFPNDLGKMDLSILDIKGEILSISQFTLAGRVKKGNRPDFTRAMEPKKAKEFYDLFNRMILEKIKLQKGVFGADMQVESINDGPINIIIDSKKN